MVAETIGESVDFVLHDMNYAELLGWDRYFQVKANAVKGKNK